MINKRQRKEAVPRRIPRGRSSAFTLIEVLVFVAITALLVAVLIPAMVDHRQNAFR